MRLRQIKIQLVTGSTTSAPTTSTPTTMPLVLSTQTLHESLEAAGGQGTNTPFGESKAKEPSMHKTMQTTSPTSWKPASAPPPESSSTSTTNKDSNSLLCEDEEEFKQEAVQRKHELEGHVEAQKMEPKKKKTKKIGGKKRTVPTENHLKIRAAADAERKWEQDLKKVTGLSEGEVSLCIGIVAKYHKSDCFPILDPEENQRYLDLAREGWQLFREGCKLMKQYPECLDQTCIDGKWYMQDEL